MKIGVLIAGESELAPNYLKSWKRVRDGATVYYFKKGKKKNVYLIISGFGKVNATIATTYLIEVLKVNAILNIGSCGANNKKLLKGTVHFVGKARYIDVDNRTFGYKLGQVPRENVWFDVNIYKVLKTRPKQLLTLGTTESFVTYKNKKNFSITKDIDAIDMEGACILQTANKLRFDTLIMIKIVSDSIHSTTDKWRKEIVNIHEIMSAFINKLLK